MAAVNPEGPPPTTKTSVSATIGISLLGSISVFIISFSLEVINLTLPGQGQKLGNQLADPG
jgi:hypothetical protein